MSKPPLLTYTQLAWRVSLVLILVSALFGAIYGIENHFAHGENGIIPFTLIFTLYYGLPLAALACVCLFLHWLARYYRGRK